MTRDRSFLLAAVAVGVLLLLSPASAEIVTIKGPSGNVCYNPECQPYAVLPVAQGATTEYTLVGDWTDKVAKAVVAPASGITAVTYPGTWGVANNASVKFKLIALADAAPGERVITFQNSSGASADPTKPMKVKILVVRKGTVTGSPITVVPGYFTEANVTVVGHNLTNAGVDVDMPGVLNKSIVSNSDTQIVVNLRFSSRIGEARGKIRFFDKACGSCTIGARYWFQGTEGTLGYTPVTILGPNAIKNITVQTGTVAGQFVDAKTSTVTVKLIRIVDQLNTRVTSATAPRPGSSATTSGVTVYWKMDPQFADPASGQFVVPAGRDSATFTVRVHGYIAAGNSGYVFPSALKVEARTGDPNATQAPDLKSVTFTAVK